MSRVSSARAVSIGVKPPLVTHKGVTKTKFNPSPVPCAQRIKRGTGKRAFRQFAAKNPFKAIKNKPYPIDHSPFQLSMKSVKLRFQPPATGMDAIRRKNQLNILWYWQWSRDWASKKHTALAKPYADPPDLTIEQAEPGNAQSTERRQHGVWFWHWQRKQEKLKQTLRSKVPMRLCKDVAVYFGPARSGQSDQDDPTLAMVAESTA